MMNRRETNKRNRSCASTAKRFILFPPCYISCLALVFQVIALFRCKISCGHFTEPLMTDALHGRAGALHGLFFSLMGITDALVRLSIIEEGRPAIPRVCRPLGRLVGVSFSTVSFELLYTHPFIAATNSNDTDEKTHDDKHASVP